MLMTATTTNATLADEIEAVNSIYDVDTLVTTSSDHHSTLAVLTLPALPFSFSVTFPHEYPDVPPQVNGTQSTGPQTKKGDGEAALSVLRDVLARVYTPGQVCLFDLIEEIAPLLQQTEVSESVPPEDGGTSATHAETTTSTCDPPATAAAAVAAAPQLPPLDLSNLSIKDLTPKDTPSSFSTPEPQWILSQPLLVSKSSFIARALPVTSLREATSALTHLISTNKKVATATHNITAWRIRTEATATTPEIVVQDSDDDGETAAGGRLLHLMQLMEVWNVVVVVTRWYGGVKLGPDRFRCINVVARDVLVRGGFAKEEGVAATGTKGKGKKKKTMMTTT